MKNKQEPKKVLTEEDIFNQKDIDAVTDYINKEQTLEQVAERYSGNQLSKLGFIEGAKWQQERMSSEALEFGRWIIQNPDFQNDSSWSLETAKFNFEKFKTK